MPRPFGIAQDDSNRTFANCDIVSVQRSTVTRAPNENCFESADGTMLFFRHWPAQVGGGDGYGDRLELVAQSFGFSGLPSLVTLSEQIDFNERVLVHRRAAFRLLFRVNPASRGGVNTEFMDIAPRLE